MVNLLLHIYRRGRLGPQLPEAAEPVVVYQAKRLCSTKRWRHLLLGLLTMILLPITPAFAQTVGLNQGLSLLATLQQQLVAVLEWINGLGPIAPIAFYSALCGDHRCLRSRFCGDVGGRGGFRCWSKVLYWYLRGPCWGPRRHL